MSAVGVGCSASASEGWSGGASAVLYWAVARSVIVLAFFLPLGAFGFLGCGCGFGFGVAFRVALGVALEVAFEVAFEVALGVVFGRAVICGSDAKGSANY